MDRDALSELYQMYSREIFLYLYSLCHDRNLSEDFMQETFLRAILSLSEQHTNMRAWLYLVARNLFLDYKRKKKAELYYEDPEERFGEDEELLSRLIASEQKRVLFTALNRLDERKREILILQYYSGVSQKEIAKIMSLSPENVRILAYRGKQSLKKYLKEAGYEIS